MTCPECDGELLFMGGLGRLAWFRCRQCGLETSRPWVEIQDEENDLPENGDTSDTEGDDE